MKLRDLMHSSKESLLSIYCTAGYPHIDSLPHIIAHCERAGVDFMEIGIPYSDPLCDGPTIQKSSAIALSNGMKLSLLFEQLQSINTSMPLVMMGYFNVVLQFGIEKFCKACHELGIEGIILPDLPLEIFNEQYKSIFDQYNLHLIYLITPETSEKRIEEIDENSTSFIYAVSTSSTTGSAGGIFAAKDYLFRLKAMNLNHPFMVGFNISNASDFSFACRYGRGAIIGSAFIRMLRQRDDLANGVMEYVDGMRASDD